MSIEKAKKFVKEHKYEILVTGACVAIGAIGICNLTSRSRFIRETNAQIAEFERQSAISTGVVRKALAEKGISLNIYEAVRDVEKEHMIVSLNVAENSLDEVQKLFTTFKTAVPRGLYVWIDSSELDQ